MKRTSPSNHIAFLQLGLPGLKRLAAVLPSMPIVLSETVRGQTCWTQFCHGKIARSNEIISLKTVKQKSRSQMISGSDTLVMLPGGGNMIPQGPITTAYLIN